MKADANAVCGVMAVALDGMHGAMDIAPAGATLSDGVAIRRRHFGGVEGKAGQAPACLPSQPPTSRPRNNDVVRPSNREGRQENALRNFRRGENQSVRRVTKFARTAFLTR